ncbi:hypothetical protein [Streptomyces hygroscopicus]|uniref:hypothetical protein n=1 Tax=Streptomyces hygroscopicus TaxID=1912 RepID=UPI0037A25E4E
MKGTDRTPAPGGRRDEHMPAAPAPARQIRHALTALAHTTPGRRRVIQAAAEDYLAQIDRRRLPVGYNRAILSDHDNRADAYRMRRGQTFARMLGLAVHPADEHLPDTARAALEAIDAPVRQLTAAATASGQPLLVAVAHCAGAVRAASAPGR